MKYLATVLVLAMLVMAGIGASPHKEEITDESAALALLAFLTPANSEDEQVVESFLRESGLAEHGAELISKAKEFHAYKLTLEDRVKRGESTNRTTTDLRSHLSKQTADLKQKPKIEAFLKAVKNRINKKENDENVNDDSLPVTIDGTCHPN